MIMNETGLTWPSLPTWEEWAEVGPRLALVSNTSRWALADWLLLGGERWPERADQVIGSLGLAYHSIENLRWVAKRVPPSVRRPLPVSFSHHALIASLPVDQQTVLLDQCEVAGWTRDEFRGYLVEERLIHGRESSPSGEWTPAQIKQVTGTVERILHQWLWGNEMFEGYNNGPAMAREIEAVSALIVKAVARAVTG